MVIVRLPPFPFPPTPTQVPITLCLPPRVLSKLIFETDIRNSFLCWSGSFYPQPILNWRRRSTAGLAIDFPTINILGFLCYLTSTATFLYSPLIRQQYAARNPRSPEPTVRFNDLAFALHAVILCFITYSQFFCWGFKRDRYQRVSKPIAGIFVGSILGLMIVGGIVYVKGNDGGRDPMGWAWIDLVCLFPIFFSSHHPHLEIYHCF